MPYSCKEWNFFQVSEFFKFITLLTPSSDNWTEKEISQKTVEKEESTVPGKNRVSTDVC